MKFIRLSAVRLAEVTYRVVTTLVPRSTVHQVALEIVKPRNLGPFPIIQGSCCLDQNITLICVCGRTFDILDLEIVNSVPHPQVSVSTYLHIPLGLFVIPARLGYLLLQLDVFHTSVLLSNTLPVLVNLGGFGIKGGPFLIGLE